MSRILVIDDQAHVRAAIMLSLQTQGFEVVAAENGPSALRVFQASNVDLVIVDVFMPGMDGIKLIKALRERDPKLPVIAISGLPLGPSGRTALDIIPMAPNLSRIICLQKPFRATELQRAIRQALGVAA
jgi:CheY-like chemotaxis protein